MFCVDIFIVEDCCCVWELAFFKKDSQWHISRDASSSAFVCGCAFSDQIPIKDWAKSSRVARLLKWFSRLRQAGTDWVSPLILMWIGELRAYINQEWLSPSWEKTNLYFLASKKSSFCAPNCIFLIVELSQLDLNSWIRFCVCMCFA